MLNSPRFVSLIHAVKRTLKSRALAGFFLAFFTLESLTIAPLLAEASMISYVSGFLAKPAQAATASDSPAKTLNSQTMALLQAPLAYSLATTAHGGGDISIVDGTSLMPETGPAGSVADLPDYPASTEISTYVVHDGDTLSSIAKLFNVSVNTILWANDVTAKTLKKDQVLVILPISGVQHTVAKGDTIESIAKKYGADAGEIYQYNDLGKGDTLAVGSVILVPAGELSAPLVPHSSSGSRKNSSLAGEVIARDTSNPYRGGSGPRYAGYYGRPVESAHRTQGLHGYNGVDLGAPTGTPILAAAGGTVIIAKSGGWNGGYGSYVVITHGNGTQTLYGHMSKVFTSVGASVEKGEVIGAVGMTGEATGPHLHFEVRGAINFCADVSNPCSTY